MTSISSDLPPSMPARRRSRVLPYVVLLILAALVAGLVWYATRPVAMLVQGEAEAPRVDVSARVPGRVVELGADVGDRVEQGALLVRLENAQLTTNLGAAQAEYQAVHGLEPGQAELQADGEHQEDHAELGEVAGLLTLRQEAEAVGADDEADGQVGQQGGQTQLLGDDDEQHRQGEQEDDAEQ